MTGLCLKFFTIAFLITASFDSLSLKRSYYTVSQSKVQCSMFNGDCLSLNNDNGNAFLSRCLAPDTRDLRNAITESGKRRFSIEEFLTPQQIKSYFSRTAAKTKQVLADEEATELAQKDH